MVDQYFQLFYNVDIGTILKHIAMLFRGSDHKESSVFQYGFESRSPFCVIKGGGWRHHNARAHTMTASEPADMGARKIVGGYYTLPEVNVADRVTAQSGA